MISPVDAARIGTTRATMVASARMSFIDEPLKSNDSISYRLRAPRSTRPAGVETRLKTPSSPRGSCRSVAEDLATGEPAGHVSRLRAGGPPGAAGDGILAALGQRTPRDPSALRIGRRALGGRRRRLVVSVRQGSASGSPGARCVRSPRSWTSLKIRAGSSFASGLNLKTTVWPSRSIDSSAEAVGQEPDGRVLGQVQHRFGGRSVAVAHLVHDPSELVVGPDARHAAVDRQPLIHVAGCRSRRSADPRAG